MITDFWVGFNHQDQSALWQIQRDLLDGRNLLNEPWKVRNERGVNRLSLRILILLPQQTGNPTWSTSLQRYLSSDNLNLTLSSTTYIDAGQYAVSIRNSAGSVDVKFSVTYEGTIIIRYLMVLCSAFSVINYYLVNTTICDCIKDTPVLQYTAIPDLLNLVKGNNGILHGVQ